MKHHTWVDVTDEELRRARFNYGRVNSGSLQQDLKAFQTQVMVGAEDEPRRFE